MTRSGHDPMRELPPEVRELLAVRPQEFVEERRRIVRELRAQGRGEEAKAVEKLRKPAAVVLAVNRAVRGRPEVAKQAVDAASRMQRSQLSGDSQDFERAREELDLALARLADVALAHLSTAEGAPSDPMRHRLARLLRAAAADDAVRGALAAGVLTEEVESTGFDVFSGAPASRRSSRRASASDRRARERHRARETELREQLARAKEEAASAEREAEDAARRLERARREIADIEAKLEREGPSGPPR